MNLVSQANKIMGLIINGEVNKVTVEIDHLLDQDSTDVLTLLNQILSQPETLTLLIRRILADGGLFKKMAADSYYHENGFHKIVLLSGRNFKLRVHHFGACAKIPMENIHDHRWAFASSILSGTLEMDVFKKATTHHTGHKYIHYIYNSDKSTGAYSTKEVGLVSLKKTESRCYHAGQNYLMLPKELHQIKNTPGQESLTLILTGKPINSTCNLFAGREIQDEEKQTVQYEEAQLKTMLLKIIEKLYPQLN
jgi:hypothetical protein